MIIVRMPDVTTAANLTTNYNSHARPVNWQASLHMYTHYVVKPQLCIDC